MTTLNKIRLRPLVALLPPVVAFILQWVFWDTIQPFAWLFFYPAVFLSAWIGGLLPGLTSTFASMMIVWWFFIPPQFSFTLDNPITLVSIGVFGVMGTLFSTAFEHTKKLLKRAGEARHASEQRLASALQWSHTGGWDLDLFDHTAYRTLEHDRIFGYESLLPQWTYEMFLEHVLPEDRIEVDRLFGESIATQTNWSFKCRIRRTDGEVRWIWAAGGHQRDTDGTLRRMAGIVQDITEQRRAELEILKLNKELEQRVAERTTELELALSTMRTSEERYRLLVDGVKDVANIMLDTSGRVISWNQGAERLKGYTAAEIIGRHFSIFCPPDTVAAGKPEAELAQALEQGRAEDEGWRVRKDGSQFWANVILTTLYSDKGKLQGFSKITRDITERKQYEQQLVVAKEAAELANRAKDSFLATMSHEIRTPLTGVMGILEVLSLTELDHDQDETLKAVWDSSRSLLRIVNDILDWSKIEEGKLALSPQSTSIPQLLQEVVNTYSRVASSKSLMLWQHADARLSAAHIVDPLRLSQVLNNFVSNALKFTQRGEIELRAELLEQLESGERIRFSVKDTGIGIHRELQQHLFQRYRQANADTTRMYGGTGLGLSICQRLADLMDGQIELASEPGQGSIFSFTLILPVSGAPGETMQTQDQNLQVGQRKVKPLLDGSVDAPLVLAVDDHPINRDLLARQIRLLGLRAEAAENGQDALSMWRDGRFALVITDCHMPEMDGYALSKAIRKIEAEERLPHTPIIAWTANALAEESEHCHAAGMDELLVKPANLTQLRKTLAKWLSIAETDSSQPASSLHDVDGGEIASPIDYEELNKTVPNSAEQIQVLRDFQSHMHAGRAELIKALEQSDPVDVEHIAHRMKGSSRMVGAMALASICTSIEQAARNGDMDVARATRTALDAAIKQLEVLFIEIKDSKSEIPGRKPEEKPVKINELNFLVVEDDDFQRQLVVNMLRSMGTVDISEASNGKQALDVLHAENAKTVDIALCDMNMPEMDGMEFLRHLGQEKSATSIIILSTLDRTLLASVSKMSSAYGMKLLGVIEKPITAGQLESLISKYRRAEEKSLQTEVVAPVFSLEEILHGLRAKQFEPFLQPKVDLKTGQILGAEALARWNHPQHGIVSPQAFIPLLEQAGKMDDLTFMMLEKSAAACRVLHDNGYPLTISVNLSLTSLADISLAQRITHMVRDAGLDPHHIVLEVTESAAMTNVAHALENLARLRMHGFGLSIDDYGTGYASMQQLTRIAFSELKIDQSFVKDFANNPALRIIVESSIDMAHKLQVKSVAEGVETQQDWDTLKSMGCDVAQGYFIAKPMHLDSFHEFCTKYSP